MSQKIVRKSLSLNPSVYVSLSQRTELYLKAEVLSFCNFCTQLNAWRSARLNEYMY